MTEEDAALLYALLVIDVADHPEAAIVWPWPSASPPARAANWVDDWPAQGELFM